VERNGDEVSFSELDLMKKTNIVIRNVYREENAS
jgi:hypothetical protein